MQKDFRTAWLLLLLRDGSSYGYELRRELDLRATDLDPAVMYRTLRDMEQNGFITSHWMRSDAGPRRRVYDITDAGRDELARIAAMIRGMRDSHSEFLATLERRGTAAVRPSP
jgi:PadR family transcriptional regulator, regulatory protein PadR